MATRPPLLIAVMGPTASGKTGVAESLADRLDAVLINADAFQVYRGLDIGTAKPVDKARYRLLDLRDPDQTFGLGEWLRLAESELNAAYEQSRHVIVVGGTGLYIRALFEEYSGLAEAPDPQLRSQISATPIDELRDRLRAEHPQVAEQTDLANPVRVRRAIERLSVPAAQPVRLPPYPKVKFSLSVNPEALESRITHRTDQMVQNGWVQEIQRLQEQGFCPEDPGFRAIGYRALWDHLDRKISLEEAIATTIAETRRYAKRQRTWLRKERNLVELPATTGHDAIRIATERIESFLM